MKVTILQTDIEWGNPQENIVRVERLVAQEPDSDLYVLPTSTEIIGTDITLWMVEMGWFNIMINIICSHMAMRTNITRRGIVIQLSFTKDSDFCL